MATVMTEDRIEKAARLRGEAWLVCGKVDAFDDDFRPRICEEVYAIQDAMTAVINKSTVGWKLGATSLAIGAKAGQDGPIIGRVFKEVMFISPITSLRAWFGEISIDFARGSAQSTQDRSISE